MDDAYIGHRYSENWALHGELSWNVGEDPVEGYSNFSWVAFNALAIRVGLDPTCFSQFLSLLSGILLIWFIWTATRGLKWYAVLLLVGAVGFNAALAFLTIQGLETTLATLLVTCCGALAVRLVDRTTARIAATWYAVALACGMTRPDVLIFAAGAWLAVLVALRARRRERLILLTMGLPFLLLGVVYLVWRLEHFGQLLPNPFYVKMVERGGVLNRQALLYTGHFLLEVLFPYLFLGALAAREATGRQKLARIAPILVGAGLFLAYLTTIAPMMGYLWRFGFPIFGALLYGLAVMLRGSNIEVTAGRSRLRLASVIILVLLWPSHTLPLTFKEKARRTTADRIAVGEQLSDLFGTMFISEAGALPYHSRWRAIDLVGLNSAEIARDGLTVEWLERFEPDLVMLLYVGRYDPRRADKRIVHSYMVKRGFVAIAAINKSPNRNHYYFARPGSPLFHPIVTRIASTPGVQFLDLETMITTPEIVRDVSPR